MCIISTDSYVDGKKIEGQWRCATVQRATQRATDTVDSGISS